MKALMKEQVRLKEKTTAGTSPEPWQNTDSTIRRARIQYLGAERALTESASLNRNVTHHALMMYDSELQAGRLLVRKEDDANFDIVHVEKFGPKLRGGRTRYMRLLLCEDKPAKETF